MADISTLFKEKVSNCIEFLNTSVLPLVQKHKPDYISNYDKLITILKSEGLIAYIKVFLVPMKDTYKDWCKEKLIGIGLSEDILEVGVREKLEKYFLFFISVAPYL